MLEVLEHCPTNLQVIRTLYLFKLNKYEIDVNGNNLFRLKYGVCSLQFLRRVCETFKHARRLD